MFNDTKDFKYGSLVVHKRTDFSNVLKTDTYNLV